MKAALTGRALFGAEAGVASGGASRWHSPLLQLWGVAAPTHNVMAWTRFLEIQASAIAKHWATMLGRVALVGNPETYRLTAITLLGTALRKVRTIT